MNTIQTIDDGLSKVTDPVAREVISNIKKAHLEKIAHFKKTISDIKTAVNGHIGKTEEKAPQSTGGSTVVQQKPCDRIVDIGQSKRKLQF
jgi:hypothetical protein